MRDFALKFALSRRRKFGRDRSKSVGASEIGKCGRQVVYAKIGATPDADAAETNGFAERGNVLEDNWTAPLWRAFCESKGGKLLYSGQATQIELMSKTLPLSSTPDGLAVNMPRDALVEMGIDDIGEDGSFVVEMKSFDPRIRDDKLPKYPHIPQIMTQIGLVRELTEHKPTGGIISYVNASDLFDVRNFPVAWDEKAFKSLGKRSAMLMKGTDPNKFMPEGKMRGGSECGECEYARACLGYVPYVTDDDPRALSAKEVAKVAAVAKKVKAAEAREEKAKLARMDAEGKLHVVLKDVGKNFVKGSGFTVHLKKTSAQTRNDAKKLIELAKAKGATEAELALCKMTTKEGTSLSVERVLN